MNFTELVMSMDSQLLFIVMEKTENKETYLKFGSECEIFRQQFLKKIE